jgi:glycine/D-amino acid oxidase-like deaminating enzyme
MACANGAPTSSWISSVFDVVIIGGGVGGAAAAYELSRDRRLKLCLLYRQPGEGSSFTNQKWKHSGLLFEDRELARFLWEAYRLTHGTLYDDFISGARKACFLSVDDSLSRRLALWNQWQVPEWGLDIRPMKRRPILFNSPASEAFDGCETPDCAIDYPALISRLLADAADNGVKVVSGADFQRFDVDSGRVSGVWFAKASRAHFIKCRLCVLACGVWTKPILEHMGLQTHVSAVKSTIVRLEGEIVNQVTVFLGNAGGTPAGLNLVPFRGSTYVSDMSSREVEDLRDRSPDPAAVATMLTAVATFFRLKTLPNHQAYGCQKVRIPEQTLNDYPLVTAYPLDGVPIRGLLAVDPLKASLVYLFALRVRDTVLRTL